MRLETERLIIREFTLDDLDAFAFLMADPEVMRFSLSGPMNKEQAREYLQKRILDHYAMFGYGLYAVVQKAGKSLIGLAGLISQIIDKESKVELGYRLHPQYWGRGLATEACLAICQYAFTQLSINELISIIDPKNIRSLEVAKRIGMKYLKDTSFHQFPVQIYMIKAPESSQNVIFRNLQAEDLPNGAQHSVDDDLLICLTKPLNTSKLSFHFRHVKKTERSLVHAWLKQPYIAKWFYGQGLENTFKHLDEFLAGSSFAQYWLALDGDYPFAFLITSYIDKPHDELTKWCHPDGQTITFDMLIGDPDYLGKGYAVKMIHQFLLSQFPKVYEVLTDPEATNVKAIHVYQKAGFSKLDEFIPSHSPHPHYMMRLNFKEMKESKKSK